MALGVDLYTDWLFFSRSKLVLSNFVELSVRTTTLASFFSLFITLYIFIYLPIIHLSIICLPVIYLPIVLARVSVAVKNTATRIKENI